MSTLNTRWGPRTQKTESVLSIPTELPAGLTEEQIRSYVFFVRLMEINQILKEDETFSTEEQEQLKKERAAMVAKMLTSEPDAQPDYLRWQNRHLFGPHAKSALAPESQFLRTSEVNPSENGSFSVHKHAVKVWLPQKKHPEINFIGLIIGPRGKTLKKIEAETGVRIAIRGKGSMRDGKTALTSEAASHSASEEELHACVSADSLDGIDRAVRIINRIVGTALSTPEEANELKRKQLRDLAAMNGTLRGEESHEALLCANCGQPGHRRFECTERKNLTTAIICRICGGVGHLTSDCIHKNDPQMLQQSEARAQKMDSVYNEFLADINASI